MPNYWDEVLITPNPYTDKLYVESENDPRYKAYQDSLNYYTKSHEYLDRKLKDLPSYYNYLGKEPYESAVRKYNIPQGGVETIHGMMPSELAVFDVDTITGNPTEFSLLFQKPNRPVVVREKPLAVKKEPKPTPKKTTTKKPVKETPRKRDEYNTTPLGYYQSPKTSSPYLKQ